MNILLGICGKPRSGKDSIAEYLEKEHGFYRYAFANYLKWLAYTYFGIPRSELWGNKTKESREFLHNLGKLLTEIDPDFLIKRVTDEIKKDYIKAVHSGQEYRAIISDVRNERELALFNRASSTFLVPEKISESGVSLSNAFNKILVVKVDRHIDTILEEEPGLEKNIKNPIESLPDTDRTWDYYIDNNSGIDKLFDSVELMISELTGEFPHDSSK